MFFISILYLLIICYAELVNTFHVLADTGKVKLNIGIIPTLFLFRFFVHKRIRHDKHDARTWAQGLENKNRHESYQSVTHLNTLGVFAAANFPYDYYL